MATTSEDRPTVTAADSSLVAPETSATTAQRSDARLRWVVNATMWLGALLVAGSAGIHLHLWLSGYRSIPNIGPLFIGQAVAGFVLAALLAWTRRPTLAVVSVLFLLGTIGGLLTSMWFGLFGFHDDLSAPYAGLSVFVEGAGAVVLCAGALLAVIGRRRSAALPR
jgi:hypothetical protein